MKVKLKILFSQDIRYNIVKYYNLKELFLTMMYSKNIIYAHDGKT